MISASSGPATKTSSNGPVVSKWLTAEGLVEDKKTVVILPLPHVALVVPAQPVETPVVVSVTEATSPPPPPVCCIPVDVALQLDYLLSDKPQLPMFFHWNFTSAVAACRQHAVCCWI